MADRDSPGRTSTVALCCTATFLLLCSTIGAKGAPLLSTNVEQTPSGNTVGFAATLNVPAASALARIAGGSSAENTSSEDELILEQSGTDGGSPMGTSHGQQSSAGRGVISDIAKVVKIAELLGTVGETVIPALVGEVQQPQKSLIATVADASSGVATAKQRLLNAFRSEGGGGGDGGDAGGGAANNKEV